MTDSSSASRAAELGGQPALVHHQDAVGHARAPRAARRRSSAPRDPGPRARDSRRWTSALVPTSMPRVGSSTISSFGFVASHLASTTFCWLPPDSVPTGSSSRWYLSCSLVPHSLASAFSAAERIRPPLASDAEPRQRRVARDREVHHEALLAAVLGHEADAGAHRRRRLAGRQAPAVDLDVAGVRAVDAEDRARDLAAARADEPGERDDLARPHVEADVEEHALAREPVHAQHGRADRRRPASGTARSARARPSGGPSRPGVMSAIRASCTTAPSRITVTVSQIEKTSSRRCEMNSTAAPCSRSVRTTLNSRSTSAPGERGGRLVHDQHARVEAERLGDLDDLLVGDRQAADRALGVEPHAEAVEQILDARGASRAGRSA